MIVSAIDKIRFDEFAETVDRELFVAAVGDQADRRTLGDAEGENAEKALGVDAAVIAFDPNAAAVFVGFLNEECGGTGVQADLVVHNDIFRQHVFVLLIETTFWEMRI